MNDELCPKCGAYWECEHPRPHVYSTNQDGTEVRDIGVMNLPAWLNEYFRLRVVNDAFREHVDTTWGKIVDDAVGRWLT